MNFLIESGDSYVALDLASGGYPFLTESLNKAEIWHNKEEAIRYYLQFQVRAQRENWVLFEFEVKTTLCLASGGDIL